MRFDKTVSMELSEIPKGGLELKKLAKSRSITSAVSFVDM